MFRRRNGRVYECVIIDLNTQRDFCDSNGAYPVCNIDRLLPALRSVVTWARQNDAPVISSLESHRQWEVTRDGLPVLCCIDGTPGQRKVDFTLFPDRVCVEVDNTLAVPFDLFGECQQVIFRKRTDDLLANPKAERFLTHLSVDEFVIVGNGLESAVKAVTLGLLARNKRVTVVLDACGYWDIACADFAVRQIAAKGAGIVTVDALLTRVLPRRCPCAQHDGSGNGGNGSNGSNGNGYHRGVHAPWCSEAPVDDPRNLMDVLPDPKMRKRA